MNSIKPWSLWSTMLLFFAVSCAPSLAASFGLATPAASEDLEFVRSFLESKTVDPGQSFDRFFRHHQPPFDKFDSWQVAWARRDLNGDGIREFIPQFQHPGVCGSGGCWSYILRRIKDEWVEIGYFYGDDMIEVTGPVIEGWPRLFSHEACLVWNGGRYTWFHDDPFEMGVDPECRR